MTELNYKASNIARAERELNANFFSTLDDLESGTPSISALVMMLRSGGMAEDEADELLDNDGIEGSLAKIVEALGRAGFLVKLGEKAQALKATQRPAKPSQSTGESTKASPSA